MKRIVFITKQLGQVRVTIPHDVVVESGIDKYSLVEVSLDDQKRIIIEGLIVSKKKYREVR